MSGKNNVVEKKERVTLVGSVAGPWGQTREKRDKREWLADWGANRDEENRPRYALNRQEGGG